jgi:Mlc titration factor MtfA (ptsG expression regulator)
MWHGLKRAWLAATGTAEPEIPQALWQRTLTDHHFLQRLNADELVRLRALCQQFLASKEFHAVPPLELTDDIALAIAVQACLPVLNLPGGVANYSGWVGIVLHAGEVVASREWMDDDGVVHTFDEPLTGEALEGGPVTLSWHDVRLAASSYASAAHDADASYNVVIHEFTHKLDMLNGEVDGMPPLATRAARDEWQAVLHDEYTRFCTAVDLGVDTYLDPYAAEHESEFFAVASEAFFVDGAQFKAVHPAMYELLRSYFQQDTAISI